MTSIHTDRVQFELTDFITQLADEPYLTKIIGKPPVPVFFVRVLEYMLATFEISKERAQIYGTAATLLQMGLDTHEKVSNDSSLSSEALRQRQLYILAGDYYSGLFYHLLAKNNEIEGVHCLGQAIARINEAKMIFYDQKSDWIDGLDDHACRLLQNISSGILTALVDFFCHSQLKDQWKQIICGLLGFEEILRLQSEEHYQITATGWSVLTLTWQRCHEAMSIISNLEVRNELLSILMNRFSMFQEAETGESE
ncbi:heptaprenyl diphosphate synthase component 1 [Hazenella coriacea]|uniref:Heptaprenyl diphosphate synthase subunit 1 n=1 Tax=Hazenella coriacea TaxID=1179467 RepID=A0A4R3L3Y7_9BACL|nr:heptaprenyl diphosphate synthase component 1 [Hazenella coriacea]TCS93400.1 heptaprenyl diphosphate synthase subunit 1 [Hazenella coriacea]